MENDQGEIYELLTTSRDVTPQRELEHALIENEALSRAIFDSLEEGLIVYDSEGLFARTIWPALESNGNCRGEIWLRDAQGQVQVTWAAMTKVQQQVSAKTHYSLILSDISEKSRKEDKLRYNAGHDSLTGVPNRQLLNDRFDVALNTAQRQGQTFACLFIDLDGFKPINDRYGHAVGDTVLQTVAEKFQL